MDRRVRRAVMQRLAAVEDMALRAGFASATRHQLRSLTGGWRELLAEHQPDRKGRCPVCSGWLRRRRWPCLVWAAAHQKLLGDGSGSLRVARKTNPFRRPRRVEVIPRQIDPPQAADQAMPGPAPASGLASDPTATRPLQLTTDGSPIHRAAVTERRPTMPRTRRARHPLT